MPLKNDWANGDTFTPAAANDMANVLNTAVLTANAIGTADQLPNESGFWWTSEPAAVDGKVYMGTTAADRGSWVQEWTQGVPDGPFYLHRYFMGFTALIPGDLADLGLTDLRDDHNPAQCAVKAGKPLVAFWSAHGVDNRIYYRISDQLVDDARPGELTFGPIQVHEIPADERTSYTEVMINGDDIWVAHRTSFITNKWTLTKFPAWATGTPVAYDIVVSPPSGGLGGQSYIKARMVSGVIRFMSSDHPTNAADNKIWYGEVNVTTGSITKADGTVLGNLDGTNLPIAQANLDVVHTSTGTSRPWGFDVGYGSTRELVFVDGPVATFNTDGKYKYARYASGSWTVSDITTIGPFLGNAYFPSITFVPGSANTVLLARAVGTPGGTNYIEKWATANSGSTWSVSQTVDSVAVNSSTGPRKALTRAYPVRVESGSAPFSVIGTDIFEYPTYYRGWLMNVRPLPLSHPVKVVPPDSPIERGLSTEPKAPTVGVYLPGTSGNYIQGPTSSATIPAEGIRLEIDVALPDWTPASQVTLFAKESTTTKREFRIWLSTVGRIGIYWSTDGSAQEFILPNFSVPFGPWQRAQIAVDFIPSHEHPTGGADQKTLRSFYRLADDQPWIALAASQNTPDTSIFTSDSPWEIGSRLLGTTELAAGIFYRGSVMTTGGTTLAEWRADRSSDQAGVQVDQQENTWRINSSGITIASPTITNLKTDLIRAPATNVPVIEFGSTSSSATPNRLLVQSSDSAPSINAVGPAGTADITITAVPKGAGAFRVLSAGTPVLEGHGVSGNANFNITTQSSGVVQINGAAALYSGGPAGTPSSGTLTNCTGLPVSGITASTSTALGVGSIEIGHASDTTVTRSAAGIVAIEGVDVATLTDAPMNLTSGENTMPRQHINSTTLSPGNGNLRLTFFTARKTETTASIRTICNVAQVGATLARIGIYTVDGSGNLTLVASTANDTTLWNATGSATRSLSASLSKVRGQRYAIGVLVVGTSTSPQLSGNGLVGTAECAVAPRLCGFVGSQTDLPSSVAVGSVSDTFHQYYAALVP
jgi:hypothetical protein